MVKDEKTYFLADIDYTLIDLYPLLLMWIVFINYVILSYFYYVYCISVLYQFFATYFYD